MEGYLGEGEDNCVAPPPHPTVGLQKFQGGGGGGWSTKPNEAQLEFPVGWGGGSAWRYGYFLEKGLFNKKNTFA